MKKSIRIGKLEISAKSLPLIIAECCDNHFGKIENAIKMVDLSKKAGVDIVKFQHHLPDEEMLKSVPKSSNFNMLSALNNIVKFSLIVKKRIFNTFVLHFL